MPIVTDAGFAEDGWVRIGEEDPVAGRVIVPFDALERRWNGLVACAEAIGVEISNDTEAGALAPYVDRLDLIAVAFPTFSDGRGFSVARRVRSSGFDGVLRAVGHVIADQYAYARACGFDEVEIDDALAARQPAVQWTAVLEGRAIAYQRGYAGGQNILDARRAARAAG